MLTLLLLLACDSDSDLDTDPLEADVDALTSRMEAVEARVAALESLPSEWQEVRHQEDRDCDSLTTTETLDPDGAYADSAKVIEIPDGASWPSVYLCEDNSEGTPYCEPAPVILYGDPQQFLTGCKSGQRVRLTWTTVETAEE